METKKRVKTGGRDTGTPNKMTYELRKVLKNILAKEIEGLPELLGKLEPKDRLEMTIKLIPYVLPKVEPVNLSEGEPFNLGW